MPEYNGNQMNLNDYHGIEEFWRAMQRYIKKEIDNRIENDTTILRVKRAKITAINGNLATIEYVTSEGGNTISNVKINGGLSVSVNDIVYIATPSKNKRIILMEQT